MKAPMANLAGLLAALPRNTASVLQQLLEKKEAGEFVEEQLTEDQPSADAQQQPAEEAEAAEEKTEDPTAADVEASDDADEETEDQADEASDDAEEE
jgi:hypothetical protein